MLAKIAIGPAIEASVLYRCEIVRNQIGPDLIAFVSDGPKLAAFRLPCKASRIADSAGEDTMRTRRPVHLPDCGSFVFGPNSILSDVAIGSDPDIELGAIWTGQQTLRPVMIDRAARKTGELGAGSGDGGLSILIRIADDCIGIRNVKIVANQGDAEGRIKMVQKYGSDLGSAISIGAAQQRDAVSALGFGAGKPRHPGSDYILRPVDRCFRTIALHHQHVSVGKD